MALNAMVVPKLDERAADSVADRMQRRYEDASREMSRVMSERLSAGARVAGQAMEEMADRAESAYADMAQATQRVAREEFDLQEMRARGAKGLEEQAGRAERARIEEAMAVQRATAALAQYEAAAQRAGTAGDSAGAGFLSGMRGALAGAGSAGEGFAGSFMEGFAGSAALARLGSAGGPIGAALAGVAAIGVTAGNMLADNIMAGMQILHVQDIYQARLGVDESTMRGYGAAAGQAWRDGYGESVEDNLTSLQFGIQAGLVGQNVGGAGAQALMTQMDTLKQITEADAREIAAGTRNFVKTGLVDSYQQAFDLITAAQQRGLNISGDLLDTAEEYGTALKGVGLSGADSFGLIAQMQAAGIRNTDVAADSIKELAINVSDGSKQTAEAFGALGLNATQLNEKFAEGGPAARRAFGDVLNALSQLDDPIQRQQVGLALFKTKWEDAKTAIQAANLDTAAAQMGNLDGRTKAATDALNAHANQWDLLGRSIDTTMSNLQQWLADSAIGRFIGQSVPQALNDKLSAIADPYNPLMLGDAASAAVAKYRDALAAAQEQQNRLGVGFANAGEAQRAHRGIQPGTGSPSVDRVPVVPMPDPAAAGAGAKPTLPPAPVLPLQLTSVDGLPAQIADAQTRLDEARHDAAEKEARVNQLVRSNVATQGEIQKARNDALEAERKSQQAEVALHDAVINQAEKFAKGIQQHADQLGQIGAQLDNDFGVSKGLAGIAENITKFLANLAFAPALGALEAVKQASGYDAKRDGSGLMSLLGNGSGTPAMLSSTPISTIDGWTGAPIGPGPGYPIPGMAQAGESARDFAHRVMMPYWQSQGFQVGDHAADRYGEHQNGALDIMVPSIGAGQNVLSQVLQDPNVYGAIFNNQTYGYGHGLTPRDYTAGHTGNPTQDHQDHVHAWYKPGGPNNIVPPLPAVGTVPQGAYGSILGGPGTAGGPGMNMPLSPMAGPGGPLGGPGVGAAVPSSSVIGGRTPGQGLPASPGIGYSGGGVLGAAASAAASMGSMGMPGGAGAGAAAQLGMQEIGRAIGAMGQYAGTAVGGVIETLGLNDSALGDPSKSWLGRLGIAAAGMRPALPNTAGMLGGEQNPNMLEAGKKPPEMTPEQAAQGGAAGKGGNTTTTTTNSNNTNVTINNQNPTARTTETDIQASLGASIGAGQPR